jgi:predicted lipoprotein with Yx(FWY)xxD motif
MTHPRKAGVAVLTIAVAGSIAALVATTHAGAMTPKAQVSVHASPLGRILVDVHGRTLYLFRADKGGKSACYGQCASFWPPLIATTAPKTGAGLKASLFGTTVRKGGAHQVTYNHHPLYRFAEDKAAGQTNGQGFNHFGGLWWVVSPSGAAIVKKATAAAPPPTTTAPPPTTTTPGYGYQP